MTADLLLFGVNTEHRRGSAAVCARADALPRVVPGSARPRFEYSGGMDARHFCVRFLNDAMFARRVPACDLRALGARLCEAVEAGQLFRKDYEQR
jgi:hypothetical protein